MTKPDRILFAPTIKLAIETELLIEKYKQQQQADGRAPETVNGRTRTLRQVAVKVNINSPEEVKKWLSSYKNWNNKTKTKFIDTYSTYLKLAEKTWNPPTYLAVNKLPFIPTEQEIDLLISGCGKVISTVLQTLKETGIRNGELTALKWSDLDTERRTLNITPEKGSNPRILPVSEKLLSMLLKMSRQHDPYIFQPSKSQQREYMRIQRRRISEKLSNPRIKQITFHTLRHWKGTMEYHKTKEIMHVKSILGHKSINCTLIYINLENAIFLSNTDEWTSKVSHSLEEEQQLIDAGFILVRSVNETTAIYKKRK